MSTLASYSESRQVQAESDGNNLIPAVSSSTVAGKQSVLFIRIQAAADYYSADKDLMANVAPISVDIILDPYLMNIFPKSLVSTAIWVVLVAVAGYFIAQIISRYIQIVSSVNQTKKES